MTSSPELSVYSQSGTSFPSIKLKPMEVIEFKIVYTPETLGLFEALFFIVLDEYVFVGSLNAYVVSN